ncbi:tetratricopeptide repeat protein [Pseudoxanthomonas sp. F37]|uniref:YfgM family protein n=1 Tax=Pseudoxanthomonas TaxID=83618 RepID=UPI001FD00B0F|nr:MULTISPECIES: tetratricopeptide repeat protein [Pseudoxanthomonas]UOV05358.1 tetratricopeptide repeat protein [Pseudoxanthomonas mexicana]UOV10361.1 tetratricopeptide repeat protein [Pseudoxanthomonas sp. F37]
MAIDDLLDEHEQSERVRSWLRNNGAGLLGGVALGLAVILGWQWLQKDQAGKKEQAYQEYQAAVEGLAKGDLKQAKAAVDALSKNDTLYADTAGLQLAKAQVQAGERDAAIATLRGLTPDETMRPLVNLRVARLLIDAGKHDEALKLLDAADDASSLEVRGDALLATGKAKEAQEAYTRALTTLDAVSPQRRLVELKLIHAGGTPPKTGGAA